MITTRTAIGLGLVAPLTLLCAVGWNHSWDWPITHDLPIMMYAAFLMERFAMLPHADFFDMNMLGAYSAYLGIGNLYGYDPVSMRWADLTIFGLIGSLTIFAFRPIGRLSGCLTVALFGIAYLRMGPVMSLQREYVLLLPMVAAFAFATRTTVSRGYLAPLGCGLCIGCAATIKPQAIVMAAPILVFLLAERRAAIREDITPRVEGPVGVGVWLAAGIALPIAMMIGVLAWLGVFDDFYAIAANYLPLYGAMTNGHRILSATERPSYLLDAWFLFAPQYPWVLGATCGAAAFFAGGRSESRERRIVGLVIGMTLAFALYPAIAGQFWKYHWLPYVFWLLACSSLVLVRINAWSDLRSYALPFSLVCLVLLGTIRPDRHWGRLLIPRAAAEGTRPQQIADFLEPRLVEGDTVQAMDWTNGGVIHGLLIAGARPATSFLYDFHFYHHVSTDYIRSLRQRFIAELDESDARFIVRGKVGPYPTGADTTREFPALETLLQRDYQRVLERPGFDIYERTG